MVSQGISFRMTFVHYRRIEAEVKRDRREKYKINIKVTRKAIFILLFTDLYCIYHYKKIYFSSSAQRAPIIRFVIEIYI